MVKIILPNPPEGYKAEAEYRLTQRGDNCLSPDGEVYQTHFNDGRAIVLTPKKRWRPARMPEDYGKWCRVRDSAMHAWRESGALCGYLSASCSHFLLDDGSWWQYCEVEDT